MARAPRKGALTSRQIIPVLEGRRVRPIDPAQQGKPKPASKAGGYRPNLPFVSQHGIQVTIRALRGLTDPELLRVPFRFQVPPINDFTRPRSFEWARYNTIHLGERSRPMGKKLLEVSIDSIFVDGPTQDDADGYVIWEGAPAPQKLLRELWHLMETAQVFRLTMAQPSVWSLPLVNTPASLLACPASQKPGELGTEYISPTFLEYERSDVDRRQQRAAGRGGGGGRPDKPRKHNVNRGRDSLYELAKRYYQQPSMWRRIADANGIRGVSPDSEAELEKWMKEKHKRELRIPPNPDNRLTKKK